MYKVVIGLEVHCEIKTLSKNFSSSLNTYSNMPNTNVSTVDLGLPGILPVLNKEAVRKAIKTAMALNCKIPNEIVFDRKNYFYPDLPKGYQITQVTNPFGINGYLEFYVNDEIKKVDIHQLHLEEDTASLEHFNNYSLIDYNRSGIPLMEIVTEPCLHSPDEAVAFLESLRTLFLYCEVSEADSKKGQMRCDVNISLMKEDATTLGTKVEMKNINSFSSVRESIIYEIKRQSALLDKGEKVIQETRRYDEEDAKTYSMREKVDAVDYKYFIEPNIPPIKLDDEYLLEIKNEIPRLQYQRLNDYIKEYDLSKYDATVLVKEMNIANYFEEVISFEVDPKDAANWVTTVVLASLNKLELTLEQFFITPKMLSDVIKLVVSNKLSLTQGKKVIYKALADKIEPLKIIEDENLNQIDDDETLRALVIEALDEAPEVVKQYKEGKTYAANYFIGPIMKKTKGQANPVRTKELIQAEIEKR
ncbi:MAG: Asp-tRNA(Asn)/Glu-tRNA(Gln) amidotransferase subunit GatB [Bacilli bacterium]|nr:Asp-tRNA(Asn)/Glu-tRNA(Gln) amidotransferase subunit GatB [Bacilli bacterium]